MNFLDLSKDSIEIGPDSKPSKIVEEGNYRYVLYSTSTALVYKGDAQEPSYEITPTGCSCPADRYRNDTCKHRKFVLALGDSSSGIPLNEEPEFNAAEPVIVSEDDIEELFG